MMGERAERSATTRTPSIPSRAVGVTLGTKSRNRPALKFRTSPPCARRAALCTERPPVSVVVDIESLCDASARGDADGIRACLLGVQGRRQRRLGSKLVPPTDAASALHGLLFSEDVDCSNGSGITLVSPVSCNMRRGGVKLRNEHVVKQRPDAVLRALLLLPPWWEPPWNAARDAIVSIQERRGVIGKSPRAALFLNCLSEVRLFLSSAGADVCARAVTPVHQSHETASGRSLEPDSRLGRLIHLSEIVVQPLLISFQSSVRGGGASAMGTSCSGHRTESVANADNRHVLLPLEILPALLSAANLLERGFVEKKGRLPNVCDSVFSVVFPQFAGDEGVLSTTVRADMLLALLTLSFDLVPFMKPVHWANLRRLLLGALPAKMHDLETSRGNVIPRDDLPGLVRGVLSLFTAAMQSDHLGNTVDVSADGIAPSWVELLLRLYQTAASYPSTLATVESVLKSSLSNMSPHDAHQLIDSIRIFHGKSKGEIPRWVCANVLLSALHLHQSGPQIVYQLTSEALGGGTNNAADIVGRTLNVLVSLALQTPEGSELDGKKTRHHHRMRCEETLFLRKMHYVGGGKIRLLDSQMQNADLVEKLSLCSELVYSSLFLGQSTVVESAGCSREIFASERAQAWVNTAKLLLSSTGSAVKSPGSSLASIIIMTTVFWEMPSSRVCLVRSMIAALTGYNSRGSSEAHDFRLQYCLLASFLVHSVISTGFDGSTQYNEDAADVLSPLADLLNNTDEPLHPCVVFELVRALSPLSSGRAAIVSMARKSVRSTFGIGDMWWSAGGGMGVRNAYVRAKIYSSLYGLCTLIQRPPFAIPSPATTGPLDEYGMEALAVLSDFIVLNKPSLPVQIRGWLFDQLLRMVVEKSLTPWTIARLLNACQAALTQYFDCQKRSDCCEGNDNDNEKDLFFAPERLMGKWGASKPSVNNDSRTRSNSRKGACLREDLPKLLRLTLSLFDQGTASVQCARKDSEAHHSAPSLLVPSLSSWGKVGLNMLSESLITIVTCKESQILSEKECEDGENAVYKDETHRVTAAYFKAMLKHMLKAESSMIPCIDEQETGKEKLREEHCTSLVSIFIHLEREAYSLDAKTTPNDTMKECHVPKWMSYKSLPSSTTPSQAGAASLELLAQTNGLLCTVFLETILSSPIYSCGDCAHNDSLMRTRLCRMSESVNAMLKLKRCMATQGGILSPATCVHDQSSLLSTAPPFFQVASRLARYLIPHCDERISSHCQQNLQELDSLLYSVMCYCDAMTNFSEKSGKKENEQEKTKNQPKHFQGEEIMLTQGNLYPYEGIPPALPSYSTDFCIPELIHGLFADIYRSIATEESAVWLIHYLERVCFSQEKDPKHDGNAVVMSFSDNDPFFISLLSLNTSRDIDEYIRHIRFNVLSALGSAVSMTSKHQHKLRSETSSALRVEGTAATQAGSVLTDEVFWFDALDVLIADLKAGLRGRSGGITQKLYLVYLETIEGVITFISESQNTLGVRISLAQTEKYQNMCQMAAIKLWDILCSFPLKHSVLFKKTLMCSYQLPCLCSNLCEPYLQQMQGSLGRSDWHTREAGEQTLATKSFNQCFDALKRWCESKTAEGFDVYLVTETQKVEAKLHGKHSNGDLDNVAVSTSGDGNNVIEKDEVLTEAVNKNTKKNSRHPMSDSSGPMENLCMGTAQTWSWAFCCSLNEMERNWIESYRIMKLKKRSCLPPLQMHTAKQECIIRYAARRAEDLASTISCARCVLSAVDMENQNATLSVSPNPLRKVAHVDDSSIPTTFAEMLSRGTKLRFCALLDGISFSLKRSIRCISRYISDEQAHDISRTSDRSSSTSISNNAALLQSLCCAYALLSLDSEASHDIDFPLGIRRWFYAEKKRKTLDNCDDPILGRLLKIVCRIEELVASLHKLLSLLGGKTAVDGNASAYVISGIDTFLMQVSVSSTQTQPKAVQCSGLLRRMIMKYIKNLGAVAASDQKGMKPNSGNADQGDLHRISLDVEIPNRKKKRRSSIRDNYLRKTRRRVLRSRNKVVDEWLGLDEEITRDRDERKDTNDAYIDLEDFLVEG